VLVLKKKIFKTVLDLIFVYKVLKKSRQVDDYFRVFLVVKKRL